MKAVRKSLTSDCRSMDGLSQGLLTLLERLQPQRLGGYFPIQSEPDLLTSLAAWAQSKGCEIYYPAVTVGAMVYRRWTPGAVMQTDIFGIVCPTADEPCETPDVIVIPCLGHDEKGRRLGYGKGCFDRYLNEHPEVLTVGLSFEKLLVPETIFEAHDRPMDYLVTENGAKKI